MRQRLVFLCLLSVAVGLLVPSQARAATARSIRLGSVTLNPCTTPKSDYCGTLPVPLDRNRPGTSPTINVGFEWLPATGTATGTIVAVEGGPGYPSTGSRDQYNGMVGQTLRKTRNVLLFDLRGTGGGAAKGVTDPAFVCSNLQKYSTSLPYSGTAFATQVGTCGNQLNSTWKYADGTYVHASDLFTTANAARDLADTLKALGLSQVDLYGDSYGSWFGQVFAARYPGMLRSLTTDATYSVLDAVPGQPDPWGEDERNAAKTAFNLACQRSAACAAHAGTSWDRITALASSIRSKPVTGQAVALDDKLVSVTVDVRHLVDLVTNAGSDAQIYLQLDAAATAYLDHGDAAPLLRLVAGSAEYDNAEPAQATKYADGAYFAVVCTDYGQIFDMTKSPADRASQFNAAVAAKDPSTYQPFTPAEWVRMSAYTGAFDACLDWPAPTNPSDPPVTQTSPPLVPSSLPVLVMSGDLDSFTSPWGNGVAASQLGHPNANIVIQNVTHVTAMPNPIWPGMESCGEAIYRQFVTNPTATLDTSCTNQTVPIPALGSFPANQSDAPAATPTSGNQANTDDLRAATVGLAAAKDSLWRYYYINSTDDLGLRGGSTSGSDQNGVVTENLTDDRWVGDAKVNGTVTWNVATGAATATLTVDNDGGGETTFTASWNSHTPGTPATADGQGDGGTLHATVP